MAGHGGGGRKKKHHEEEHENEERWLVSFADMMTLLMCLFMVLFSISSVNTSKLEALSKSMQDAFSGRILPGGEAVMQSGNNEKAERESATPPLPALTPLQSLADEPQPQNDATAAAEAAREEQEDFENLKRRIDALVKDEGLAGRVETSVRRKGLVVQLLTDEVFFDSGRAELKAPARRLLPRLAAVINGERRHPVAVEGHTDAQPVSGQGYRSNWGLSGARAESVVLAFEAGGVPRRRMTQVGYAEQQPIASNATPGGRSRNRRVEVVLARQHQNPTDARRQP